MRVLVATPLYPPELGGPATYSRLLEKYLPGEGIEVRLVKFADVRHLPKLVRHVAYFWHVFKEAKDADVVLALDPVSTGLPAALAAVVRRKPYAVKVVGDYAWEQGCQRYGVRVPLDLFVHERAVAPQVTFLRFVQRRVAKGADVVIVPSKYLKRIVSAWGVPEGHIVVIYNAVAKGEPAALPESVEGLSRPRIVTAGRLVPWKGISGVIDAVEKIRSDMPDASLVIIGDGPERANLERYASVRLGGGYACTGALGHGEVLATLMDADVFVLNSTYEGLSHVLIEALSAGVACIATDVGGNPELVRHEENGLLVSAREPGALAEACLRLLKDGTLRARLQGSAKETGERFSTEAMVSRTAELLRALS